MHTTNPHEPLHIDSQYADHTQKWTTTTKLKGVYFPHANAGAPKASGDSPGLSAPDRAILHFARALWSAWTTQIPTGARPNRLSARVEWIYWTLVMSAYMRTRETLTHPPPFPSEIHRVFLCSHTTWHGCFSWTERRRRCSWHCCQPAGWTSRGRCEARRPGRRARPCCPEARAF